MSSHVQRRLTSCLLLVALRCVGGQEYLHPTGWCVLSVSSDRNVRSCAVGRAECGGRHPLPYWSRRHPKQRSEHVSHPPHLSQLRNAPLSPYNALTTCLLLLSCSPLMVLSFMQEMLETAQILHLASPHSLVIVDEMGRGTSTEDGLGLAWATAEFLARRGSFSLFATHFHEMRALAEEGIGAINKHVTALIRGGVLEYLYEVREGASEESLGVECMGIAKLPPGLVSNAREKLRQFEEERSRGGGLSGGGEQEQVLRRDVQNLKLRLEALRMRGDDPSLSNAERQRETEAIRAKASELKRRLRDLAHTSAHGRNGEVTGGG